MDMKDYLRNNKAAALFAVSVLAVLIVWAWALRPLPPIVEAVFLSVGQGDSAVLITPSRHVVVVDCGPGGREGFDAGRSVVVPFLKRKCVDTIDALIITHPHEDHIGGAISVLKSFRVRNVLDAGVSHPTGIYLDFLKEVKRRQVKYVRFRRGSKISFNDGVSIEALNPPAGLISSADMDNNFLNDNSIVLIVKYRDVSLLFAGDAGRLAEEGILNSGCSTKAQVLKVAHHGSERANSAEWVKAVDPKVAVISVGRGNQFGHPSVKVLKRLEGNGVRVYRTDLCGGITVITDGRRIAVDTVRK